MCPTPYKYEFSLWHTEHDTDIALRVAGILEQNGYHGFVEHRDQAGGVQAILEADAVIQSSRASFLLLSSRFLEESWCRWVSQWCLQNAIEQNAARVIPVYTDLQDNQIPEVLRYLTGLNYNSQFFKKKLLDTMKAKTRW